MEMDPVVLVAGSSNSMSRSAALSETTSYITRTRQALLKSVVGRRMLKV